MVVVIIITIVIVVFVAIIVVTNIWERAGVGRLGWKICPLPRHQIPPTRFQERGEARGLP